MASSHSIRSFFEIEFLIRGKEEKLEGIGFDSSVWWDLGRFFRFSFFFFLSMDDLMMKKNHQDL